MTISHWTCPVCQQPLAHDARQYRCANGHCFDEAREGYVNLLLAQHRHSTAPGDDRQMLQSRREFLDQGFYQPLAEALVERSRAERAQREGAHPFCLLDTGCGEGYDTARVADALRAEAPDCWIGGIDIAKEAVRMAARRYPQVAFAAASNARLPVGDASLDAILRVFAPGNDAEVLRALRPGGLFLHVTPGPRHLFSLRAEVYATPREHDATVVPIEGLEHVERIELRSDCRIEGPGNVARLLSMTPYYWQADAATQARIQALEALPTTLHFLIDGYRRPRSTA